MKKDKKIIKKLFNIFDPVFHSRINVFLNYTDQDINKILTKNDCTPLEEDKIKCEAFCFYASNIENIIFYYLSLPIKEWTLKMQAILSHEIIHLVSIIIDDKRINDGSPYECRAYLFEYYFYHISKKIGEIFNLKDKKE